MLPGWTGRVFPASGMRPWTRAKNRKALIDLSERAAPSSRALAATRDAFFLAGRSITVCVLGARGIFGRVLTRAIGGEVHVRIVALV